MFHWKQSNASPGWGWFPAAGSWANSSSCDTERPLSWDKTHSSKWSPVILTFQHVCPEPGFFAVFRLLFVGVHVQKKSTPGVDGGVGASGGAGFLCNTHSEPKNNLKVWTVWAVIIHHYLSVLQSTVKWKHVRILTTSWSLFVQRTINVSLPDWDSNRNAHDD